MIYTAIIFLIGTCIVGGNNNTVFPAIALFRGWGVSIHHVVSGVGAMLKGIAILLFGGIVTKYGPRNTMAAILFITAALVVVFGHTGNLTVMIVVILELGLLASIYEKNGAMKITANWWPTQKGVVLGFTTMGIVCMNFIYVPGMPKLFGSIGIPFGMDLVAIIIVIVAVLTILFVKNTPEEAGTYPDGNPAFIRI